MTGEFPKILKAFQDWADFQNSKTVPYFAFKMKDLFNIETCRSLVLTKSKDLITGENPEENSEWITDRKADLIGFVWKINDPPSPRLEIQCTMLLLLVRRLIPLNGWNQIPLDVFQSILYYAHLPKVPKFPSAIYGSIFTGKLCLHVDYFF